MKPPLPPSRRPLLRIVGALLAALYLTPLAAHDLWLEPATFRPAVGQEVDVTIRLGEGFTGDGWPRIDPQIKRFTVLHGGEERPMGGVMGDDPAGHFAPAADGAHTLLYWNHPDFVALGAEKFEPYLKKRGLERILALREERGETGGDAGEYYSRCAKALVITRGADEGAGAAGSDCEIDLVMEPAEGADPSRRFRLHFRGKPLEGALIIGLRKGATDAPRTARTDARGEARFPSLERGTWLFSAVHMIREERGLAQWHSYWASLTFEQ